jgi:hypothetical protein
VTRIVNAVWSYDFYGDMRTVDVHIKNLRLKLGEMGDCIQTVRASAIDLRAKNDQIRANPLVPVDQPAGDLFCALVPAGQQQLSGTILYEPQEKPAAAERPAD